MSQGPSDNSLGYTLADAKAAPPQPPKPQQPSDLPPLEHPNKRYTFMRCLSRMKGDSLLRHIPLETGTDYWVGRLGTNNIYLNNASLSRKHAEIKINENDDWTITDYKSKNGTYVTPRNGAKRRLCPMLAHVLEDLDLLQFGAEIPGTKYVSFRWRFHKALKLTENPDLPENSLVSYDGSPLTTSSRPQPTVSFGPSPPPQEQDPQQNINISSPRPQHHEPQRHQQNGHKYMRCLFRKGGGSHLRYIPLETGIDYSVGRHASNNICLVDAMLSRKHAEIKIIKDGDWTVSDTKSVNGTYVTPRNGIKRRLDPMVPHILEDLDLLQFGAAIWTKNAPFRWRFCKALKFEEMPHLPVNAVVGRDGLPLTASGSKSVSSIWNID